MRNIIMSRDNLAKLCALLSAFREFSGDSGVDEAFGVVWDEATKGMNNDELAEFHRHVSDLRAWIDSGETVSTDS